MEICKYNSIITIKGFLLRLSSTREISLFSVISHSKVYHIEPNHNRFIESNDYCFQS